MILDENLKTDTLSTAQNPQSKVNRFAVTPAVIPTEEQSSATLPTPASQLLTTDFRVIFLFKNKIKILRN